MTHSIIRRRNGKTSTAYLLTSNDMDELKNLQKIEELSLL